MEEVRAMPRTWRARVSFWQSIFPAVAVAAALLAGCGGRGDLNSNEPVKRGDAGGPAKVDNAGPAQAYEAQVRRYSARVRAGAAEADSWPPQLEDDSWHQLRNRDLVLTDAEGEAWLEIEKCMRVYLFQKSGLRLSNCEKASDTRGNPLCGVVGTMVFNKECKDKVKIQTGSAEIELDGTWVAVTFLPREELSLIAVLKGTATVRPVTDLEEGTLGEPSEVPENSFYFTRPGREAGSLEDLAGRRAHPLDRLTPLVKRFNLMPWVDRINERAKDDGLPPIPVGGAARGRHAEVTSASAPRPSSSAKKSRSELCLKM